MIFFSKLRAYDFANPNLTILHLHLKQKIWVKNEGKNETELFSNSISRYAIFLSLGRFFKYI